MSLAGSPIWLRVPDLCDYIEPVRLAALMKSGALAHDSIGVGEDGRPIGTLASLQAIPGLITPATRRCQQWWSLAGNCTATGINRRFSRPHAAGAAHSFPIRSGIRCQARSPMCWSMPQTVKPIIFAGAAAAVTLMHQRTTAQTGGIKFVVKHARH